MGKAIKTGIASFAYYDGLVTGDLNLVFDIKNNSQVSNISLVDGILDFDIVDAAGYHTIASTTISEAFITMPYLNSVSVNAVVLGVMTNGSYAVLYLEGGGGYIRAFWADGHVQTDLLYTMPSNAPSRAKGEAYVIKNLTDRIVIEYSGYSQEILLSEVPNLDYFAIGVLGTGSNKTYNFSYNL